MQTIKVAIALLVVAMAVVAPALPSASADSFTVTNRSQHPINITCASKNDHLGTNVLSIGQERDWHFGGWPWTKFCCDFYKYDGKYLSQDTWSWSLYFYHANSRDINWALKEAGIFLEHDSKKELFGEWKDAPTSLTHN